jgi:DNA-binding transcriptional LysR family regulator
MSERNVTRAGQRVGLSQPAVSSALNRLRGILGDELFVRRGGEMVPTARALTLAEPIIEALRRLEFALGAHMQFDPSTARRDFVLRGADYVSFLLVPPLIANLTASAPGIGIRCLDAQSGSVPDLLEEGRIDLAVEVMHELDYPIRSQFLWLDRYVVIARADHPDLTPQAAQRREFDLDLYCTLPHALYSFGGGKITYVDAALAAINRRRLVALSAPHFLSIAMVVATSSMIATFSGRLAHAVAPLMGLRIFEPPIELAPVPLAIIWHRRTDSDSSQIWLREQIIRAARVADQGYPVGTHAVSS